MYIPIKIRIPLPIKTVKNSDRKFLKKFPNNKAKYVIVIDMIKIITLLKKDIFGPATLFEIPSKNSYMFGIIAPHNDDFCKTCNRIRLNSEESLR